MLDDFAAVAPTVAYRPPQRRLVSNVTGAAGRRRAGDRRLLGAARARRPCASPTAWRRCATAGVDTVRRGRPAPGAARAWPRRCVPTATATWVPSLRRGQRRPRADPRRRSAPLYVAGAAVDWDARRPGLGRRRSRCRRTRSSGSATGSSRPRAAPRRRGRLAATRCSAPRIRVPRSARRSSRPSSAPTRPAWLADHRLGRHRRVPGQRPTSRWSLAARPPTGDRRGRVARRSSEPLVLARRRRGHRADGRDRASADARSRSCSVAARRRDGDAATVHATRRGAARRRRGAAPAPRRPGRAASRPDATRSTSPSTTRACDDVGLTYGPAFRGLDAALAGGDGAAVGLAALPAEAADARPLPPPSGAARRLLPRPRRGPGSRRRRRPTALYVPVAVDGLRARPSPATGTCLVRGRRRRRRSGGRRPSTAARVDSSTPTGAGGHDRPPRGAAGRRAALWQRPALDAADRLYELDVAAASRAAEAEPARRRWLVVRRPDGVGERRRRAPRSGGCTVVAHRRGCAPRASGPLARSTPTTLRLRPSSSAVSRRRRLASASCTCGASTPTARRRPPTIGRRRRSSCAAPSRRRPGAGRAGPRRPAVARDARRRSRSTASRRARPGRRCGASAASIANEHPRAALPLRRPRPGRPTATRRRARRRAARRRRRGPGRAPRRGGARRAAGPRSALDAGGTAARARTSCAWPDDGVARRPRLGHRTAGAPGPGEVEIEVARHRPELPRRAQRARHVPGRRRPARRRVRRLRRRGRRRRRRTSPSATTCSAIAPARFDSHVVTAGRARRAQAARR